MKVKNLLFIVVLLIMAGYNYLPANSINTSSLLIKDPNNTSPAYIKRIEEYNSILATAPIPVFIMDQNDLSEKLKTSLRIDLLGEIYGLFIINGIDKTFPDEFIFININHPPATIITTFFHEYQHYQCKKTECYCVNANFLPKDEQIVFSILREKHAMESALRRTLETKDHYLILDSIFSITNYALYDKSCIYKMAALIIVSDDLWKEAITFIAESKRGKLKKVR